MKSNYLLPSVLLLSMLTLAGCGGGGGGSSSGTSDSGSASSSTNVSGVAGTGAAMSNALIQLRCATGSAQVQADETGAFTIPVTSDMRAPCALSADLQVQGSSRHFSVLDSITQGQSNVANINPATTIIAHQIASGNAESLLQEGTDLSVVTPQTVANLTEKLKQALQSTIDPLKGNYVANKINSLDKKFDLFHVDWNESEQKLVIVSKLDGSVIVNTTLDDIAENETEINDLRQQYEQSSVNPSQALGLEVMDSGLRAQFEAALNAPQNSRAALLDPLISESYRHQGQNKADFIAQLVNSIPNGATLTIGRFDIQSCSVGDEETLCTVKFKLSINNSSEIFETQISGNPSGWTFVGDQLMLQAEFTPTRLKVFETSMGQVTSESPISKGIQIYIPTDGSTINQQAFTAVAYVQRQVFPGMMRVNLSTMYRDSTQDYLIFADGSNFLELSDELYADIRNGIVSPHIIVEILNEAGDPIHVISKTIDRHSLNNTLPSISAFAQLTTPSLTAFSQYGRSIEPSVVSWTSSLPVKSITWNSREIESGNLIGKGDQEFILEEEGSFPLGGVFQANLNPAIRNLYLVTRGSEFQQWTRYIDTDM